MTPINHRRLLRKYFIMGSQNCESDPLAILEEAAKAGITLFQYREKGPGSLTGEEKIRLGRQLREICKRYHIPFIVNDDVELVELLDADGIHVGQDDISLEELRAIFPNKIIGLSISTKEELDKSPVELVDYIGAGPVYPTTTKIDAKATAGLQWIRSLRQMYPGLAIVGIGGINTTNAQAVLEAGADGVSFISVVTKAHNIKDTIRKL